MSNQPQIRSGSELNYDLREKVEGGHTFRIYNGRDRELLCFSVGLPGQISWSQSSMEIRDAAERLNLIQISTEFYPSSASQQLAEELGVKVDDQNHPSWTEWFRRISNGAHILPDTNILLKRTLSSVIIPKFRASDNEILSFVITVPRLAIFELENLANSRGNERASKGECFMALNELRILKNHISLTEPLSADEINAFSSRAGSGFADALIREEIRKFGFSRQVRVIFLTRDMVSALTANAESQ